MPSRPRQRLFCMADGYQDLNGWGYIDQVTVATCYCLFQIRMYISIGFCRLCFQQSNCVFSGVCVTLVLCVCFVDRCLSFYPFSFGHCVLSFFDLRILFTTLVSSNSFFFQNKSANFCGQLHSSPLEFNVLFQSIAVDWSLLTHS